MHLGKSQSLWLFFFVIIAIIGTTTALTLKNVQALIRHGARTPYTILPQGSHDDAVWYCHLTPLSVPDDTGDYIVEVPRLYRQRYIINEEALPGNCSQGQLTEIGYDMHIQLGTQWRNYYIDTLGFLSDSLNPSEIYVRSTDVPRTIQSAQSNLLGMYPPNKRSATSVVDIFTLEASSETLVPNNRCPNFMTHCDQVQNTPAWEQQIAFDQPLLNYLVNLWNTTNVPWWIGLWDNFEARQAQGFDLPNGVSQDMVDQIVKIAITEVSALYQGKQAAQMSIGPWIGEMFQTMNNAIMGVEGPKWTLYSGHDVTFALVLNAFNIDMMFWPPYAANLVMELWQDDIGEYFVQFVYMDTPVLIPGCPSTVCPFAIFEVIAQSLIPANWNNECGISPSAQQRGRKTSPLYNEELLDSSNLFTAYFC